MDHHLQLPLLEARLWLVAGHPPASGFNSVCVATSLFGWGSTAGSLSAMTGCILTDSSTPFSHSTGVDVFSSCFLKPVVTSCGGLVHLSTIVSTLDVLPATGIGLSPVVFKPKSSGVLGGSLDCGLVSDGDDIASREDCRLLIAVSLSGISSRLIVDTVIRRCIIVIAYVVLG